MPYDNNVPLSSDVIANTTTPIRNNFAFLQTDLQYDHSFNGNLVGVQEGAHGKCSMPSSALSPALGTGISGTYFVNSGTAYFYDGTTNWILNSVTKVVGGPVTLNNTSNTTLATIPANFVGYIVIWSPSIGSCQFGCFFDNGTNVTAQSCRMRSPADSNDNSYVFLIPSGHDLRARTSSNIYNSNDYYFRIFYGT